MPADEISGRVDANTYKAKQRSHFGSASHLRSRGMARPRPHDRAANPHKLLPGTESEGEESARPHFAAISHDRATATGRDHAVREPNGRPREPRSTAAQHLRTPPRPPLTTVSKSPTASSRDESDGTDKGEPNDNLIPKAPRLGHMTPEINITAVARRRPITRAKIAVIGTPRACQPTQSAENKVAMFPGWVDGKLAQAQRDTDQQTGKIVMVTSAEKLMA